MHKVMFVCVLCCVLYMHGVLLCSASSDSRLRRYVTTFYWASASSTSVGYGDIVAYTDFEVGILYSSFIFHIDVTS